MLKLEEIKQGMRLHGLSPDGVVEIFSVQDVLEDTLEVIYKLDGGAPQEAMLTRDLEAQLSPVKAWTFNADPVNFKLAAEAYRMSLAHLIDPMMAVHSSNVEPLPHQITAVYESMLPRQPLRFVLADDPGAGKTIMAGLLIRELIMRSDAQRVLIVAPGSLVEQWKDEMSEKFDLQFQIFMREMVTQGRGANPFVENDLLIARIDQLSRDEELLSLLDASAWDLIIVDEAHKLSASYSGDKIKKTKRYQLGEKLSELTRHYLLMTATPHNGKEDEFQLFLSLLDRDRFYGKARDAAVRDDVSDIMRRMVKEKLVKFDGTPLFPQRIATTLNYPLSLEEQDLYEAVTEYVKEQFNLAERLQGTRKGTVGFALTSLQRRLASSPRAIHTSLGRRRDRLQERLDDLRSGAQASVWDPLNSREFRNFSDDEWDPEEDLSAESFEELEREVVDLATASESIPQLEKEISLLHDLEQQAADLVRSDSDCKWDQLSTLLQDEPEMRDANGAHRKIIIFTEHRDTLEYLTEKISNLIGNPSAVVVIHGGVHRDKRREVQEAFRHDPGVRVLIATDAAGEGVNLQNANLMVNYDLPWNPNRLEQRFGRIHRIGQTQVCHLWNLVASTTREGEVFARLFEKLNVAREALSGQVFDVLGEAFDDRPLKDMLLEAIRHGESEEARQRMFTKMDSVFDETHLRGVIEKNALCDDVLNTERLFAVKGEMERAEALKLQPGYVSLFFKEAFEALGGDIRERAHGRYAIQTVPASVRDYSAEASESSAKRRTPIPRAYANVCFEREQISLPNAPRADLIHPGHPLMEAVTQITLKEHRSLLKEATILVDPSDYGAEPTLLFILDHVICENTEEKTVVSQRMQFVGFQPDGTAVDMGVAPHIDFRPLNDAEQKLVEPLLQEAWLDQDLERKAKAFAVNHIAKEHLESVQAARRRSVEKTLRAVDERLRKELEFQDTRLKEAKEQQRAGMDVAQKIRAIVMTQDEIGTRLTRRTRELNALRSLKPSSPRVLGAALVIPRGWFQKQLDPESYSVDVVARQRVEFAAMKAVMDAERAMGHLVKDVSAQKVGWDVESVPPVVDGRVPDTRFIEVKGRKAGSEDVTLTRNEVIQGAQLGEKYILALVFVDGDKVDGPYYVRAPFQRAPDAGVLSEKRAISEFMKRATRPC